MNKENNKLKTGEKLQKLVEEMHYEVYELLSKKAKSYNLKIDLALINFVSLDVFLHSIKKIEELMAAIGYEHEKNKTIDSLINHKSSLKKTSQDLFNFLEEEGDNRDEKE